MGKIAPTESEIKVSDESPATRLYSAAPMDHPSTDTLERASTKYSRKTHPKEFNSWKNAKRRCRNPSEKDAAYRDRPFDAAFDTFAGFMAHMGPRPGPEFTLDRIDGDGGYVRDNVRWADKTTQARNRSSTRLIQHAGREWSLTELSEHCGVKLSTLSARLKRGATGDDLICPTVVGDPALSTLQARRRGARSGFPWFMPRKSPAQIELECLLARQAAFEAELPRNQEQFDKQEMAESGEAVPPSSVATAATAVLADLKAARLTREAAEADEAAKQAEAARLQRIEADKAAEAALRATPEWQLGWIERCLFWEVQHWQASKPVDLTLRTKKPDPWDEAWDEVRRAVKAECH